MRAIAGILTVACMNSGEQDMIFLEQIWIQLTMIKLACQLIQVVTMILLPVTILPRTRIGRV